MKNFKSYFIIFICSFLLCTFFNLKLCFAWQNEEALQYLQQNKDFLSHYEYEIKYQFDEGIELVSKNGNSYFLDNEGNMYWIDEYYEKIYLYNLRNVNECATLGYFVQFRDYFDHYGYEFVNIDGNAVKFLTKNDNMYYINKEGDLYWMVSDINSQFMYNIKNIKDKKAHTYVETYKDYFYIFRYDVIYSDDNGLYLFSDNNNAYYVDDSGNFYWIDKEYSKCFMYEISKTKITLAFNYFAKYQDYFNHYGYSIIDWDEKGIYLNDGNNNVYYIDLSGKMYIIENDKSKYFLYNISDMAAQYRSSYTAEEYYEEYEEYFNHYEYKIIDTYEDGIYLCDSGNNVYFLDNEGNIYWINRYYIDAYGNILWEYEEHNEDFLYHISEIAGQFYDY